MGSVLGMRLTRDDFNLHTHVISPRTSVWEQARPIGSLFAAASWASEISNNVSV